MTSQGNECDLVYAGTLTDETYDYVSRVYSVEGICPSITTFDVPKIEIQENKE